MLKKMVLLMLILISTSEAADVEIWKSYTKMNSIRAIALDEANHSIWCATTGGALRFDISTFDYQLFTNTEKLLSNRNQTVAVTAPGEIWFGSDGDGLCKYTANNFNWVYYRPDLRESIADVNDIFVGPDYVWFATETAGIQGLREGPDPNDYLDDSWNLLDISLGLNSNTVRSFLIASNGDWWFGTTTGVSVRRFEAEVWEHLNTDNSSLKHNTVNDLQEDRLGRIWIATEAGLNRFDADHLVAFGGPGRNMRAIAFDDTIAIVATNRDVYRFWYDARENVSNTGGEYYDVKKDREGNFWLAAEDVGLVRWDGSDEWIEYPVNAPVSQTMTHLAVDHNGDVWTTTGYIPIGADKGMNKLDVETGHWTQFHSFNSPLPMNRTTDILIDSANRKFVGTYNAGGVTLISADESTWRVFSPETSELVNPNVNSMHLDADENLWISCYTNGVDVLTINGADTTWVHFEANDGFSNPWVVSMAAYKDGMLLGQKENGLDYLSHKNTIANKSDDEWINVNPNVSPLTADNVTALAVDHDNYIWMGTPGGIWRFNGDDFLTQWNEEQYWDDSVTLQSVPIHHIFVDRSNNKWFSTPQGLYLLHQNADGSVAWTHYTRSNSDIVDDFVYFVTENNRAENPEIWIATARGTSRLIQYYSGNSNDSSLVYAFPNPYRKDAGHTHITFNGIPENAELRVFNVAGDLVREWTQYVTQELPDNQIRWNLKNEKGERITSGIYFFTVSTLTGTESGKFAIIK